jgi:hypothetical protein
MPGALAGQIHAECSSARSRFLWEFNQRAGNYGLENYGCFDRHAPDMADHAPGISIGVLIF